MGSKTIGSLPEEQINKYDSEADQLGLSRNRYLHNCIEVGRTIFYTSGQVDIERLRALTEGLQTTTTDSDLATVDSNLAEAILTNLPTEEHRSLTKTELREAIFGTEDEQTEQITKALKKLRQQGKIEPLVDDGYIKTND